MLRLCRWLHWLVVFVASPVASAINRAALRVQGGVVRSRTLKLHLCARSIGYNFGQNEAVNVNRTKQSYGSGFLQSI
ncbi:hypothetical protein [Microcoleus sp. herbarium12]|uniref:hypothetical protein n=1 Tax=Microcoleus sp. herbarium12 TaxID=3055437 RepID=UPI002FD36293